MTDDKPLKHKPNQKHTLNEVLKSLQDLIRADLVPQEGDADTPAVTASTDAPIAEDLLLEDAPPHQPAPTKPFEPKAPPTLEPLEALSDATLHFDEAPVEPKPLAEGDEDFGAVLDALDELITKEIVEPTQRTHAPEPPDLQLVDDIATTEAPDGEDELELIGPADAEPSAAANVEEVDTAIDTPPWSEDSEDTEKSETPAATQAPIAATEAAQPKADEAEPPISTETPSILPSSEAQESFSFDSSELTTPATLSIETDAAPSPSLTPDINDWPTDSPIEEIDLDSIEIDSASAPAAETPATPIEPGAIPSEPSAMITSSTDTNTEEITLVEPAEPPPALSPNAETNTSKTPEHNTAGEKPSPKREAERAPRKRPGIKTKTVNLDAISFDLEPAKTAERKTVDFDDPEAAKRQASAAAPVAETNEVKFSESESTPPPAATAGADKAVIEFAPEIKTTPKTPKEETPSTAKATAPSALDSKSAIKDSEPEKAAPPQSAPPATGKKPPTATTEVSKAAPEKPSAPIKNKSAKPEAPPPAPVAEPPKSEPPKPASSKPSTPASPPKPTSDDIPILSEVAEVTATPAKPNAPLPSSKQARDIAIRVIARLNIERRKAGELPLDIRAIERLQKILTETLKRHENKDTPKGQDDN